MRVEQGGEPQRIRGHPEQRSRKATRPPTGEEQPPAEAGQHHEPSVHPGFAGIVHHRRTESRQPDCPEPGRLVEGQPSNPPDQSHRRDPTSDAQGPSPGFGRSKQVDPALKQERMKGRPRGVDLEQSIDQGRGRGSLGQAHGHDLVVPEAELAQPPGTQAGRECQDEDEGHHAARALRHDSLLREERGWTSS